MLVDSSLLRDLIGVPFESGARGPNSYDCFGLVREAFLRHGRQVPDYKSPEGNAEIMAAILSGVQTWEKVEPRAGVMVVLRLPMMMHCGFMLPSNKMIHCWKWSGGVCIEPMSAWQRKVMGYYDYTR